MDPSHKFSVEYNLTIVMNSSTTKTVPLWRLTVFTKADPHSQTIEKVSYASYPYFKGVPGGIDRRITNDSRSNFEIGFDGLFAGPRINVTAYFKDKTVEYPVNPVNILLYCRPDLCPIEFNITPNIQIDRGLNVELTGNVTAKYGTHITSIQVDWGDGKSRYNIIPPIGNKPFTFSHAYHTTDSRTITISATNDRRFTLNQVVTTTSILAQRNLPKDSPVRLTVVLTHKGYNFTY